MKKAITVMALCLLVAFMTSCQTKEEKVVNKFKALAERVQKDAETLSDSQWENVYSEFESLQTQAKECEFSAEQLKEVAKSEAELTAAIAKQKAKEIGNGINDIIEEGKNALEGMFEGLKEGLSGDEAAEETAE